MQEPSDARLCVFCGYTLTPACGSNIEARGCHFYRKIHFGEGDSTDDASQPYSVGVNHQADAAKAEADWEVDRKAYQGEPTLGPLAQRIVASPDDLANLKGVATEMDALLQASGDAVTLPPHYTRWKIEPIFFIEENRMPFWMGNVIKYVTRAEHKNGIEDLRKARRYIDMRIKKLEGDPDWAK